MSEIPTTHVAVLIERRHRPSVWEEWRFRVAEVLHDGDSAFGAVGALSRTLRDDGQTATTLFPALPVTLHRDEAEGYYLNLSSGNPVWFVMWRISDDDPSLAWPERVTLSYNEAGRMLDAQERVDNLPLPPEVVAWLQAYTDEHHRPEPKKRRRPASFQAPEQR